MANTWIVVADASRARVLQVAGRRRLDEALKDLAWFKVREIERYFAKGSGQAP